MKVFKIIQNEISRAQPGIHKTRLNTLFTFVHDGLRDQNLTVTYFGRGLKNFLKQTKSMILNVPVVSVPTVPLGRVFYYFRQKAELDRLKA
jgi:hypothetical protein